MWLLLASTAANAQPAQQDEPTFRTTTRMVLEIVTVTSPNGQPLEHLTARDFVLTENGQPRTLAICEFQRLDDSPAARLAISNEPAPAGPPPNPAAAYRGRRLLVLYFDLSLMSGPQLRRARDAARQFITERRQAADLLSIVAYRSGAARLLTDFTASETELLRGLNAVSNASAADPRPAEFGQNDLDFNLFRTDRSLAALQTTIERLGAIGEQKALVYFAGDLGPGDNGSNLAQMNAVTNAAVRAHVSIFPVDTRGLLAWAPAGDASVASPGGTAIYDGTAAQSVTREVERSQDALYALAAGTGGKAFLDANNLLPGLEQAQRSITSHYVLGYYTGEDAPDGKLRKIRITLAAYPQARLEYRRGYYAPKQFAQFTEADRERQLEEALRLEDPIVDLPLSVQTNYFQITRAEYYVPVSVRLAGSELVQAGRRPGDKLVVQILAEIRDQHGALIQNLRDRVEVKLDAATLERLSARAVDYDCGFTLLPGNYRIKLLVRDDATGRMGTSLNAFTVPNLLKEQQRIPVSSLVLSRRSAPMAEALYHAGRDAVQANNPLVRAGAKLIPNTTGVFRRADLIRIYAQAYQPAGRPPAPLSAYVTLYRAELQSALVQVTEPHQFTSNPRSHLVTFPLELEFPLTEAPSGRYLLQVTIVDAATQRATFLRRPIQIVD
jgi:VWFA-related protein